MNESLISTHTETKIPPENDTMGIWHNYTNETAEEIREYPQHSNHSNYGHNNNRETDKTHFHGSTVAASTSHNDAEVH